MASTKRTPRTLVPPAWRATRRTPREGWTGPRSQIARVYARVVERGPVTARALEASFGSSFTTSANPRTIVAFYLSKLKRLGLLTTTSVKKGGAR